MSDNIYGVTLKIWDEMSAPVEAIKNSFGGLSSRIKKNTESVNQLKKSYSSFDSLSKQVAKKDELEKKLARQQNAFDQLAKEVSLVEKAKKGLINQSKAEKKQLAEANKLLEKHQQQYESLAKEIEQVDNPSKEMIAAYKVAEKQLADTNRQIKKYTQSYANSTKAIEKNERATLSLTNKTKTASRRLTTLTGQFERQRDAIRAHKKAMKANGIDIKNLASEEKRLEKQLKQTNDKLKVQKRLLASTKSAWSMTKKAAGGAWGVSKMAAFSGLGVAGAGAAFNKLQGEQVRELEVSADVFNVSTEELQAWRLAAKGVHIDAEKMADLFKDVNDKVGDFALTGGGEAKDLFEKLHLDVKKLKSLSPDKMLLQIGKALDQSKLKKSEKVFLLESLANDASLLLPLLEENGKAIDQAREKAHSYGIILSESEKEAFRQSQLGWAEIGNRIDGVKNRAGAAFNDFLIDTGAFEWVNQQLDDLIFEIQWLVGMGEVKEWFDVFSQGVRETATEIKEIITWIGKAIDYIDNLGKSLDRANAFASNLNPTKIGHKLGNGFINLFKDDDENVKLRQPETTIPALKAQQQEVKTSGELHIKVDSPNAPVQIKRMRSEGMDMSVDSGVVGIAP